MTTHHLGPLSVIESCRSRRVELDGVSIVLVRIGDDVYALQDRCSHADIALSEGEIWCDEREIECWKHGSTFSLVTGEPQTLPATQPVPVYEARVEDGEIVVVTP